MLHLNSKTFFNLNNPSRRTYQHLKVNKCQLIRIYLNKTKTHKIYSIPDDKQKRFYTQIQSNVQKNLSESFLNGTSANYVEQMYESWKKDPNSVHASWASFFHNMELNAPPGEAWTPPPKIEISGPSISKRFSNEEIENILTDHYKLLNLVRAYQVRGHELADIDPLGILNRKKPNELELSTYGFTEKDLDKEFFLSTTHLSGVLAGKRRRTLREILRILEQTYCRSIGVEFMHIQSREQSNWIRSRVELDEPYQFSKEKKIILLDRLTWATNFEGFLKTKYVSAKRFGLEGCEVMIPGLKALIDRSADLGVQNIVLGMAHRGRMNVLANVVRKPLAQIFNEFESGHTLPERSESEWGASGDVKYHLGTSYQRPTLSGKKVNIISSILSILN